MIGYIGPFKGYEAPLASVLVLAAVTVLSVTALVAAIINTWRNRRVWRKREGR